MPMFLQKLAVAAVLCILTASIASADGQVPLRDGLYAHSAEHCAAMRDGDFDMAPYSVEKNGRLISGPEEACVVASIKRIRANRYHVQTDCREYDEISQRSFILDTPNQELFRIEGEEYLWCVPVDAKGIAVLDKKQFNPASLKKMSNRALIDFWARQNAGCRGGHGNDPETYRACGRRQDASEELTRRKLCYRSTKAGLDWVRCR